MTLLSFHYNDLRLDNMRDERKRNKKEQEWKSHFSRWGQDLTMPITFDNPDLQKIILAEGIGEDECARITVDWADRIGAILGEQELTTAQIRAVFGEVRQIQSQLSASAHEQNEALVSQLREKSFRRLRLLKPKMAYRAQREKGQGVKKLVAVLDPAIDLVFRENDKREESFKRFIEFFEAILAYHRAYGGS